MYCIRIRTRRGIYSEIWPEPKGVRFFRIYAHIREKPKSGTVQTVLKSLF